MPKFQLTKYRRAKISTVEQRVHFLNLYNNFRMSVGLSEQNVPTLSTPSFLVRFEQQAYLWNPYDQAKKIN